LTFDEARKSRAVWSPDGQRVAFRAGDPTGATAELHIKDARGGAEDVVLKNIPSGPSSWSRDGRYLLIVSNPGKGGGGRTDDLWLVPLVPPGEPRRFMQTALREYTGRFSPDGRWIAYSAGRDNSRSDIYVSTVPPGGGPWQVSTAGGDDPRWREDGGEIYYRSDDTIVATEVNGRGTTFQVGTSRTLLNVRMSNDRGFSQFSVTPDGKRFLVNQRLDTPETGLVLVVNWPALLKK
jgi:Tol biopolymer transport system component